MVVSGEGVGVHSPPPFVNDGGRHGRRAVAANAGHKTSRVDMSKLRVSGSAATRFDAGDAARAAAAGAPPALLGPAALHVIADEMGAFSSRPSTAPLQLRAGQCRIV
jgi:hypothetical protein